MTDEELTLKNRTVSAMINNVEVLKPRRLVFVPDPLGLYGQVTKRRRWMPWRSEAMKDVLACDKLRGVGK